MCGDGILWLRPGEVELYSLNLVILYPIPIIHRFTVYTLSHFVYLDDDPIIHSVVHIPLRNMNVIMSDISIFQC